MGHMHLCLGRAVIAAGQAPFLGFLALDAVGPAAAAAAAVAIGHSHRSVLCPGLSLLRRGAS